MPQRAPRTQRRNAGQKIILVLVLVPVSSLAVPSREISSDQIIILILVLLLDFHSW